MAKRAVKVSKFKRISLNITVPVNISKDALEHLEASVDEFVKNRSILVVDFDLDFDMKSVPVVSR